MDSTTSPYGTFYNEKFATADLRSYRKKGPNPWTRTLIEALKAEGVEDQRLSGLGAAGRAFGGALGASPASSSRAIRAS